MSRATATVLFTDLVGSTELRARLGEAPAEELRRTHDRLLTQAVEAHAGRVVKGLGDGIMATFAAAADAVAAAVAIQQAIDRHNRTGPSAGPLELRVGVSLGDVTFEDNDVHGTSVIEAARLCAAAHGGHIFASDVVRALAQGPGAADFVAVGPLELKGLAHPVVAWEIAWEPLATSWIPVPALLTDPGRIFVGRDDQLQRLGQLWKEATAGERRVAFLAGEPGVGKTRLAAELAVRVHADGATVLAGRCDEDLGVPYQPFVEALRHFVDHTPPGELRSRLGRYGGELGRLIPELAGVVPGLPPPLRSDPETERYRLFDSVATWLDAVSADDPLLLVLDDLQWAAKPTLLLLRHVIRSVDRSRLLVLGTYRDTELGGEHPLAEFLPDVRGRDGIERLPLLGLDSGGVAAFMEQAAGHALEDAELALARAIHEETEGNPFFVREVLRHLAETGAIGRQEGRWATRMPLEELGIPEGVRDVVGRRLSRLSPEANQALRVAAVVGTDFEVPVVGLAGRLDHERVLGALEEAAAARLVVEAGGTAPRYRFAHALVRATLYEGLSAARRAALHGGVAEAIEASHGDALDDDLPALAHHWARAGGTATDTGRAVDYAVRAGDRALAQLAHDEAAAYYRQALDLLPAVADGAAEARRLELLISLGEAERRAGDPAHRSTLLQAAALARQRGDAGALARAALANSRSVLFSSYGSVDAERVAALEAALALVPETELGRRAELLASLGLEVVFAREGDRPRRLSDEALALARRSGDPTTIAKVLLSRYYSTLRPDTLDERLRNSAELVAITDQLPDQALRVRAAFLRHRAAMEIGDLDEADSQTAAAASLLADIGQPTLRWIHTWWTAGRALLAARLHEAEQLVGEGRELGTLTGQPDADWFHLAALSYIRVEQDRIHEVVDAWETFVVERRYRAAAGLYAWVCSEAGNPDEARRQMDAFAPPDFSSVPLDNVWLHMACATATTSTTVGDRERCAALFRLLEPYADQIAGTPLAWLGSVSHYLGLTSTLLGHFEEAELRFAAAEATHARIGAPACLARTRLEWARLLLTRRATGDDSRARGLLTQATATAREFDLAGVERRAVELLERAW